MENLTINELINKYRDLIPTNELEFFQKNTRFKNKKRVIEKLNRKFQRVETTGRGGKLRFQLDGEMQDAVMDKRSIATTNKAVLLLTQNADNIIGKDMIGKALTSRKWLKEMGLDLIYSYKFELYQAVQTETFYGNDSIGVDINNYCKPEITDVLNSRLALKNLDMMITRFYGRLFESVKSHSKRLKFEKKIVARKGNADIELNDEQLKIIKKYINQLIQTGVRRNDVFENSEFKKMIKKNLKLDRIWTEYELIECLNIKKVEEVNREEITKAVDQMLIDSVANQEFGQRVQSMQVVPYRLEKSVLAAKFNDYDEFCNLFGEPLFENEYDSIFYRMIRDQILTESVASLIYEKQKVKVDMSVFEEKMEAYNLKIKKLAENDKKLARMLKKYGS